MYRVQREHRQVKDRRRLARHPARQFEEFDVVRRGLSARPA